MRRKGCSVALLPVFPLSLSRGFSPLSKNDPLESKAAEKEFAGTRPRSRLVRSLAYFLVSVAVLIVSPPPPGLVLAGGNADPLPASSWESVLTDPQRHLSREVTLEGVLKAEGPGFRKRFFLERAPGAGRLELTPWLPLEVYHRPGGKTKVKTMGSYVGRRLRLTGYLVEEDGKIILKVKTAQEL
jgi:hypothetical protein